MFIYRHVYACVCFYILMQVMSNCYRNWKPQLLTSQAFGLSWCPDKEEKIAESKFVGKVEYHPANNVLILKFY